MEMNRIGNVRPVSIEDEMRTSYIDYAMSVIVARALPDVRDGLKPVHRRILYTMHEMGLRSNAAYRKCAGVVGEAMAKYHPHGDLALYETLVRMAQDFSLRYPARRRAGQLRLDRRRPAGRDALHRGADGGDHRRDARRHREGDRRLRRQLRRSPPTADRAALEAAEPARQRLDRDRGRHGDEHPAAQPRRGFAGDPRADRQPRPDRRRPRRDRARPRLPDRRHDLPVRGPAQHPHRRARARRRDPAHVRHRPRPGDHARPGRLRGGPRRPHGGRRDRAAVPGEQDDPHREDGGPRRLEEDHGRRRHSRRERQGRHADRRGGQARRIAAHGHAAALQAHRAPDELQREHARPRRRPAADARPEADARALHQLSARRRSTPHRVRSRPGAGASPHPRGAEDRPRQPRRGDRDDPRRRRRRRRANEPHQALRADRGPGQRHPRDAAATAGRARAQEDRGRVHRDHQAHQRARGPARQPAQDPPGHHRRAARPREALRRRSQDPDRGRFEPRADRRGPRGQRGRGRDAQPARLHQAPADLGLPLPAARRSRQARDADPRGGCGPPPGRGEHARQHPLLHEPRPRLHHQGPHAARRLSPGEGPPDHQPARRAGRTAASTSARSSACRSSSPTTTS